MSVEAARVIWSSTREFAVVLTKKHDVEHTERVFASMALLEDQLKTRKRVNGVVRVKTPFLVVFGYNKCSVSNPNDFNTHTSSL